jgi:hypothetical protein
MTAYIPRFHDFDDMTERRRLPNTIRFLSKLLELVFFVLKPDQQSSIFLHCAISWSCEEVVAQRGPKSHKIPPLKASFPPSAFHQRGITTSASRFHVNRRLVDHQDFQASFRALESISIQLSLTRGSGILEAGF